MAVKKSKMKRKSVVGKAMSKSPSKKTTPAKIPPIKEPFSKSDMIKTITSFTGLNKPEVVAVIDCITQIIEKHLKAGGPGVFILPGLMKMMVVKKPARPARKGVNPFTGEEIMIKAKPAYKTIKIKALKKLKTMVS